jgi:hypothetical protein
MQLEVFDVFSIFISGLTIGLIGAHYVNKHELKLAYNRGVMDALWEVYLIGMRQHLGGVLGASRDEATGCETGNQKTVWKRSL